MFETILPTVARYAQYRLRDPELESLAIVLAWWAWHKSGRQDLPASVWARQGVRAALAGRDLPGVQSSKLRDLWDNATCWGGGGMGEVTDRRPGPAEQVESQDAFAHLLTTLTAAQRLMVDAVLEGHDRTEVLARELGCTPGRISQLRREILKKARQA